MVPGTARRVFVVISLWLCGVVAAQLPPGAQEALDAAREAAAQAQQQGIAAYPDAPLWRDAIREGQNAARLAPGAPGPLRFLAEVYTTTRWYVRAWDAWKAYREVVGSLDAEGRRQATQVGNTLAYLRYEVGELDQALGRYLEVVALNPDDPEAYRWSGRILLETGRPDEAVFYWERVLELDPGNEGAAYFLALAQDEVAFGTRGARSFYDGVRRYEAGDVAGALEQFRSAIRASPDYKQAYVWAGRAALELRQPDAAAGYWQRVLELDPSDERAAFFLELAQDQVRWGVGAVAAFREGVALYEQGDLAGARTAFGRATQANPAYPEAWAWQGRTGFEQEAYQEARQAYERALALEPDNETYRYFFEEAGRRLEGR